MVIEEADLAEASKTRVGGREPDVESKANSREGGKATHEEHSRTGMELASHIWVIDENIAAK